MITLFFLRLPVQRKKMHLLVETHLVLTYQTAKAGFFQRISIQSSERGLRNSSFRILPGLKCVLRRAGTCMMSPVRGLRAAGFGLVFLTSNTPKPLISIRSPCIRLSRIATKILSTIFAARFCLQLVSFATRFAKSRLVVVITGLLIPCLGSVVQHFSSESCDAPGLMKKSCNLTL